jgi:hypothetical protein
MKYLLMAIMCTVIGTSVYAKDANPKKDQPLVTKVEMKATSVDHQASTAEVKNLKGEYFRKQMAFVFYDNCGGQLTVWVSAGNAVPASSMYSTAYYYACGYANVTGCFID